MSAVYIGRIDRLEIGLTDIVNTNITNVILFNWERNHDVRPRLYANLKYPRTYQQPHSWVIGSFSLLSDNHDAIYATDVQAAVGNQYAMYEDADSNVIDFFQVTYQNEAGVPCTTRFYYAIIYRYNKELLNYDDSVWVYHFMAGYATEAEIEEICPLYEDFEKEATNPIWETADYAYSALTPDNSVILRSPTTGAPVLYDAKYWMAFSAINDGIGLAYSVDLVNWTEAVGGGLANPILDISDPAAEAWEEARIAPCDFLDMSAEAGHGEDFWLFYKGRDIGLTQTAVGIATSDDMITWTRDLANNPIADWIVGWIPGAVGVEDFRVQKMSTGDWMSLYEVDQQPTAGAAIGAAFTADVLPNTGWADMGPVLSAVPGGGLYATNPTVIRRDCNGETLYHCYYEYESVYVFGMYAYEATIFDLDGWTQLSNPLLDGGEIWEDNEVIPNGLIFYNNLIYMYYTGNSGVDKAIGLATSVAS